MTTKKVWQPVPESLEYDLTTHAIKHGEIPKPYRVCEQVDADAAPVVPDDVLDEIKQALITGRQLAHSPIHLAMFDDAIALLARLA